MTILDLIFSDAPPTEIKNEILKLKEDERNRAIAMWVCHYGFDELVPKKNELVVPQEIATHRQTGRKTSLSDDFWHREDIATFLAAEKFIETTNKDNKEWLEKIVTWLDKTQDQDYITMVHRRIGEFDRFFSVGRNLPYKEHPYEQNDEIDEIKEMFGGITVQNSSRNA